MVPEYLEKYMDRYVRIILADGKWASGHVFGFALPEDTPDGTWGIVLTKKRERSCVVTFPTKTITETQVKEIDIIKVNLEQRVINSIGDGYWWLKNGFEYVWWKLRNFIFRY